MKRLIYAFSGIIALLIIAFLIFKSLNQPKLSGELDLTVLSSDVDVYFDSYGIPHIEANNSLDAYKALGYIHAQDRLWQMELMRRIAPGRLSEVLGDATLETDKFFKALDLDAYHEESLKFLEDDADYMGYTKAYLEGVNTFIKEGTTPLEFRLLGIEKEEYEIKDVLNVIGYMSFSFAQATKIDPLISAVRAKLGDEYANSLNTFKDPNTTMIPVYKETDWDFLAYNSYLEGVLDQTPVPLFQGSNSWVVGPQKTMEGAVIFANDPHIGYAQPGVWYQAHMKTPDFERYGFHLGLMPFPLLAHSRSYAFGLTMFINDDMNFYRLEEEEPGVSYRYGDELKQYRKKDFQIEVKGADEPLDFSVDYSIHGPVMNDLVSSINEEDPVALAWIYSSRENHLLEALYGISHAKSKEEFKSGASKIHAPGLNVMYGDSDGNVAWWASAQLYKIASGESTVEIMDGSNPSSFEYDWLSFDANPRAENGPLGYVYSANNQPDSIMGDLYPGYYLPEDRAKRIMEVLGSKNDFDQGDIEQMIVDNQSAVASVLTKSLLSSLNDQVEAPDLLHRMAQWKGDFIKDKIEPTIYTKLYFKTMEFAIKDELGEAYFDLFMNTHLQKRFAARLFENSASIWWDDRSTSGVESKEDIIAKAWSSSLKELVLQLGDESEKWTWDKVHRLTHKHALSSAPIIGEWLNVGEFAMNGGNEVINNQLYQVGSSGVYEINAGPSSRRIIDFSDVESARAIVPTGQSGNPFSPHYNDQAELFAEEQFIPMLMNWEEIKSLSNHLRLKKD